MKVNIWSDVRCPFCYIGKRKFETALEQFSHKEEVEVIWRSFELDPHLQTQIDKNLHAFLAEIKGMTLENAKKMNLQVKQIAHEIGLDFNLDDIVVANSYKAHQLIQYAKTKGLANEAEEQLFHAHFTAGKNIDHVETLCQIGAALGFSTNELKEVFASNAFAEQVRQDEANAQSIGVRGVPFFVFNDKFALSGAQPPEVFLETLDKAWADFRS